MSRKQPVKIVLLLLLVMFAFQSRALAAVEKDKDKDKVALPFEKAPVEIKSKKVTYHLKEKKVLFEQEVIVRQRDLVIYADKAFAFLDSNNEIEKIVLTGLVKVVKGDVVLVSTKTVYLRKEGLIIITGEPRAWKGKDFLEGERITYDLNTGELRLENASITINEVKP